MDHYKELAPAATARRAEEILRDLGICFQVQTYHPSPNIYSALLTDSLRGWSVNGKGASAELSIASAYGEAMERLQNPFFTYSKFDCDESALTYKGFYYFPDEETASWKAALQQCPDAKTDMQTAFVASDDRIPEEAELENLWNRLLRRGNEAELRGEVPPENREEGVVLLPYYAVKNRELRPIPEGVVRRLCGTNGLCAGNTLPEALCQGLSEIFERYVKRLIFTQQLTPPVVPDAYMDAVCPALRKEMETVAKECSCKILVWDCSLGKGYPVLACGIIDAAHQAYRIKFGAHPIFRIALERCVTEMLQGYARVSLQNLSGLMTSWSKEEQRKWNHVGNLIKGFWYDGGSAPNSFFRSRSSWRFHPWEHQEGFTNADGVRRMLSSLLALSHDVYIRDNSFLGFRAYRIYVPGISTIGIPCGLRSHEGECLAARLAESGTCLDAFSNQERATLIRYLTEYCPDGLRIKGVPVELMVSALYTELRDYEQAAFALNGLSDSSSMVKCAQRELELRVEGYAERDRDNMLELFFSPKAVRVVKAHYRCERVLWALLNKTRSIPSTWKSLEDAARGRRVAAVSALHRKLKEQMCITDIKQEKFSEFIDYFDEK